MLLINKIFSKTVIKNFSFLAILQIVQLIVGFVIYPYLIKTLGTYHYGIIAYSQTIVGFFIIILNYGFNISGTKQVSQNVNDDNKLSKVISSIYFAKVYLIIVLIIIFSIIIFSIPFISEYKVTYILTFISMIGWLLYPEWYFQGIQKMGSITIVIVLSKLISVLFIFLLVKDKKQLNYVPIINSISMVIAGVFSVFLVKKSLTGRNIGLCFSHLDVISQLKEGLHIFISNIAANTKDYFNTIIVGYYLNYNNVAIYDLANKIVRVLTIPNSTIYRVVFPSIVISKSEKEIQKIEYVTIIYSILILALIYLIPDSTFFLLIDNDIKLFKSALYILAISIPLLAYCGSIGMLRLIAQKEKESLFSKSIIYSIIIYFIVIMALIYLKQINIITISITLIFVVFMELFYYIFYNYVKKTD